MIENKEVLLMTIKLKKLFKEIKKRDVGGIASNVYVAYFDITWNDSENTFDYEEKLVDLVEFPEFHFPKCKVCKNKKKTYLFDESNLISSLNKPFTYRTFICSQCKQAYKADLKIEFSKYIDRTMCFPAKDKDDAMKYVEAYLNRPDDDFMSNNITLMTLLDAYSREQKMAPAVLTKNTKINWAPTMKFKYKPFKPPIKILKLQPIKPIHLPKFVLPKVSPIKINFKPIKIKFKPIRIRF